MQEENVHQPNFSVRLGNRMAALGLSQHALASQLHTTQSTVRGWLQGALPRERLLKELAKVLNVNAHWLRTGSENVQPETASLREEATAYKFTQRTSPPRDCRASELLSGCLAMLEAMPDVNTTQALDYATLAFEKTWEKFKAAKLDELNQLNS